MDNIQQFAREYINRRIKFKQAAKHVYDRTVEKQSHAIKTLDYLQNIALPKRQKKLHDYPAQAAIHEIKIKNLQNDIYNYSLACARYRAIQHLLKLENAEL